MNPELYYAPDNKKIKAKAQKNAREKEKADGKEKKRIVAKTAKEKKRVQAEVAKVKKRVEVEVLS